MIPRLQEQQISTCISANKIVLVTGPRKVGKSTLITAALNSTCFTSTCIDCSDKKLKKLLLSSGILGQITEDLIVLEEAQHLKDLQEVIDRVLGGQIRQRLILSCSFLPPIHEELYEALKLSGLEIKVYAPSFYEAANHFGLPEEERLLGERLIYGNYPGVLTNLSTAEQVLKEIIHEAIDTHLGANERINKREELIRMLQILAFNIGDAVSYFEVGERVGLDNETVERYVDLLEKADLLVRLPSFSHDHRYELKKSNCIYFLDNGIRNALINNFNAAEFRNDMPELWKNYLIAERVKWIRMNGLERDFYFWKTHTKQQIDLIEIGGKAAAFKIDWEKRKKVKIPGYFTTLYPEIKTSVLNRSTYWGFLTRKN